MRWYSNRKKEKNLRAYSDAVNKVRKLIRKGVELIFYFYRHINPLCLQSREKQYNMRINASVFYVLTCFFFFGTLKAQESDSTATFEKEEVKTKNLEEVVVSATRTEKDPASVGRNITVITKDDLNGSIYQNVAEVLSQQEGIYIVGNGQNPGSVQSIFMRGANSNHTTVMIDGVRITDPSTPNNQIDLSELSLASVERIEIIRGAHSTMYGSSAIGGVVNIITKKHEEEGLHAKAELRGGVFGWNTHNLTENTYINVTSKKGFYASAEIYNTNVKGLDNTIDTITDPNAYREHDRDGFTKADGIGKLGYHSDEFEISLGYKYSDQRSDLDRGAFADDENYIMDFSRHLITYQTALKLNENVKASYRGGFSSMLREVVNDSSATNNARTTFDHTYYEAAYSGTTANNEIQVNLDYDNFNMVFGAGRYDETMSARTYTFISNWGYENETDLDSLKIKASINNMFVHADFGGGLFDEKLKPFNLGVGIRSNSHSEYEGNFTYEINPSFKINKDALIYASYTTGFNAPSLYQLYAPDIYVAMNGDVLSRGNDDLLPEESVSYELGIKQKINKQLELSASYFNTVVGNAIEYVYLWDVTTPIDALTSMDYKGDTYVNVGTQYTEGIDIGLRSKLNEKLYWGGTFSLVSGRITYDSDKMLSKQSGGNHVQLYSNGAFVDSHKEVIGLPRRSNVATIFMTYMPNKKIAFRTDIRHVGGRSDVYYNDNLGPYGALSSDFVKDYTLADVSVNYKFSERISAGMRVENLFDTKYYEIFGYNTRRRGVFFNIRYEY